MKNTIFFLAVSVCLASFMPFLAPCASAQGISARYAKIDGNHVTVEIKISAPAPKTILFTQSLPPGTTILKSAPPYSKYDKMTGTATWLLKEIRPGKRKIHFITDKPVSPGSISGVMRFRDPEKGKVMRITIAP